MTAESSRSGRRSRLDRRRELVEAGSELLREGGPNALTSVAVAERVGIAQSAVYRYVRNMEELTALAAAHLLADLERVQRGVLLAPTTDPAGLADFRALCRELVSGMIEHADAYATVDQWRFAGGVLGAAISEMFDHGHLMVASILEHLFRSQFAHPAPFSETERAAQHLHARLIHDDAHALARLARADSSMSVETLALTLQYRLNSGWVTYVIDMHDRLGLPLPDLAVDAAPSPDGRHG